ncbi:hypothetical protein FGU71_11870 [Erythrobacter insulae]|uniref:Uncharacterized protein n=1 Tax=Erythrobacter insulae TaxID=2584124 RepID=A0A547PEB6_9SPHN|nr:hypothetical protein [Erythrobacter insulae]TRD12491.1 hypothetical protein FGU71_11870 [Erythrobacter insulae]
MFQQLKIFIVGNVGLARDALHIYVALIVFLAACWVFRWPASSWKPWLAVLVVAIFGEVSDFVTTLSSSRPILWDYHWTDMWNTMLAPTMIVLAARYTSIFDRQHKP